MKNFFPTIMYKFDNIISPPNRNDCIKTFLFKADASEKREITLTGLTAP